MGPGGNTLLGAPAEDQQALLSTPERYAAPVGEAQPSLYSGGSGMFGGTFSPPSELAGYFDTNGNPLLQDPRQVAAESGATLGELAGGLMPSGGYGDVHYNIPNDRGGFFSLESLIGLSGKPTLVSGGHGMAGPAGSQAQVIRMGGLGLPGGAGQMGMGGPSTNNWRLLGRGPGWIMRNGQLINLESDATKFGLPYGADSSFSDTAESGTANYHRFVSPGAALAGMNKYDAYYWPGADSVSGYTRSPAQTNV